MVDISDGALLAPNQCYSGGKKRSIYRILNKFRAALNVKMLHHRVLMKGNGPRGQLENERRFLHRAPFGQQLQNLFLPRRQVVSTLQILEMVNNRTRDVFRQDWGDVRVAASHLTDGINQLRS